MQDLKTSFNNPEETQSQQQTERFKIMVFVQSWVRSKTALFFKQQTMEDANSFAGLKNQRFPWRRIMKLWRKFIKFILVLGGFRWIVNVEGDAGFRVFGVEVYYYKHADLPLVYVHDDPPEYREAKRYEIQVEVPYKQEKLCTDCKRWYACNQIKPITPQTLACDVFEGR